MSKWSDHLDYDHITFGSSKKKTLSLSLVLDVNYLLSLILVFFGMIISFANLLAGFIVCITGIIFLVVCISVDLLNNIGRFILISILLVSLLVSLFTTLIYISPLILCELYVLVFHQKTTDLFYGLDI